MASGNISAALSCDIRNVFWGSLIADFMTNGAQSTKNFKPCFTNAKQNGSRWKKCELNMAQTCTSRYTVTVVKTIRLRMSRALEIVERDPKVKVLHLVRDPRPVLLSRRKLGFADFSNLYMEATKLCDLYKADISASKFVSSSRYRLFRYEDIVLYPELSVELMYNFSGLVLSAKTLQHILSKEFSSNKRNVLLNQNILFEPWRSSMTLKDVNVISRACEDILSVLGYRKYFDSEATLKNISISAVRRSSPMKHQ